jgi:C-terminal processing protease CtpA/Prc
MIPKFKKANTELAFHLAINELVVRLDDSHAGFSSKILREHFGNYHTPYLHRFVDQNYVVTNYYNDSLAKLNGLQTGDIIKKVDGKKPWDIFQKRLKYISGSNLPRKKIASWIMITSGKNESVELELLRGNKRFTKKISRYLSDDMGYSPKKRILPEIDSSISYMFIKQLNNKRLNALKDGLENKKAWILDLRTYPKYSSGPTFANVLSKKEKVFCKVIKPDFDYPSRFYEYTLPSVGRNSGLKYNGKVFLLVNSYTQSAAEFQAMQIQTGENVTTIGSQTSGADGNVTRFEILENLKTAFSGIGIFYPDGTETQRKGVRIDIQVPITIDGIRTGRDEVLEKAIELANKL